MPSTSLRLVLVPVLLAALGGSALAVEPPFTLVPEDGAPAVIAPGGTTLVRLIVLPGATGADPTTGLLFWSVDGAAFQSAPLLHLQGPSFQAELPALPCFGRLRWYASLVPAGGGTPVTTPAGAPTFTHVAEAIWHPSQVVFADDFEADLGWSVANDAALTDGAWERGAPVGGGDRGDPAADADGSGACYLTDNTDGNSDVDGGATTLTSPAFDLAPYGDAVIRAAIWYDNDFGGAPGADVFTVEVSDDDGQTWALLETYAASVDEWVERTWRLPPGVQMTCLMRVRFTASDFGPGSVVEAGVDAFRVLACAVTPSLAAAAGTVGAGTPEDALVVNGSAGGDLRRVEVGFGQPIRIDVAPPSGAVAAPFILFGRIGAPNPANALVLPAGIGTLAFATAPLAPFDPTVFTLTDNIAGSGLAPSTPAPWSVVNPAGVGVAIDVALQGLMIDPSGPFSVAVTNGVLLRVTDAIPWETPAPSGTFPAQWIHGAANCATSSDPPIQVHAYDANTYLLRQSACLNFEAPFLYLLLGQQRALLIDSGATSSAATFPLRATVQALVDQYELAHGLPNLELVVAHSHSHGDHVAADGQFAGQPATTVVGTSLAAVQAFYGITSWPQQTVTFDLGGRTLDVIPCPGHHATHVAFYDRQADLLFTGDTLYPGYLFISNQTDYRASIARLAAFASQHPIAHVLGGHIEMTSTPGVAYPYGTVFQPNERVPQLGVEHLIELHCALLAMPGPIVNQVHDDFIITP